MIKLYFTRGHGNNIFLGTSLLVKISMTSHEIKFDRTMINKYPLHLAHMRTKHSVIQLDNDIGNHSIA